MVGADAIPGAAWARRSFVPWLIVGMLVAVALFGAMMLLGGFLAPHRVAATTGVVTLSFAAFGMAAALRPRVAIHDGVFVVRRIWGMATIELANVVDAIAVGGRSHAVVLRTCDKGLPFEVSMMMVKAEERTRIIGALAAAGATNRTAGRRAPDVVTLRARPWTYVAVVFAVLFITFGVGYVIHEHRFPRARGAGSLFAAPFVVSLLLRQIAMAPARIEDGRLHWRSWRGTWRSMPLDDVVGVEEQATPILRSQRSRSDGFAQLITVMCRDGCKVKLGNMAAGAPACWAFADTLARQAGCALSGPGTPQPVATARAIRP